MSDCMLYQSVSGLQIVNSVCARVVTVRAISMDYNDYCYSCSPSYHMYAFQGPPTGLETQLSASAVMNPVSETHECRTDSRHRVSVGVLPTVAVKVINLTK